MTTKTSTTVIAQTAVLSALVVVFDYTMKFSGFKIIYPWLPYLKFDFTGIPIALSFLLIGLLSGATTSTVAMLAILVRSGDVVSAFTKALAEFSTILGMSIGMRVFKKNLKLEKPVSFIIGCLMRVVIMAIANLVILPLYTSMTFEAALLASPLTAVFNLIQGSITIFGGYLIYEALKLRVPSLIKKKDISSP
jgi:riboflavin transporter FmnP